MKCLKSGIWLQEFKRIWKIYTEKSGPGSVVGIATKLVRNRQTQQINKIGHELQGVLYKVRQDDMFRST